MFPSSIKATTRTLASQDGQKRLPHMDTGSYMLGVGGWVEDEEDSLWEEFSIKGEALPRLCYDGEEGQAGRELLTVWEAALAMQRAGCAIPGSMDQLALLEAQLAPDSGPSMMLASLKRVLQARFQAGVQGELDVSEPSEEFYKVTLGSSFGDSARIALLRAKDREYVPSDAEMVYCVVEQDSKRLRPATQLQVEMFQHGDATTSLGSEEESTLWEQLWEKAMRELQECTERLEEMVLVKPPLPKPSTGQVMAFRLRGGPALMAVLEATPFSHPDLGMPNFQLEELEHLSGDELMQPEWAALREYATAVLGYLWEEYDTAKSQEEKLQRRQCQLTSQTGMFRRLQLEAEDKWQLQAQAHTGGEPPTCVLLQQDVSQIHPC